MIYGLPNDLYNKCQNAELFRRQMTFEPLPSQNQIFHFKPVCHRCSTVAEIFWITGLLHIYRANNC